MPENDPNNAGNAGGDGDGSDNGNKDGGNAGGGDGGSGKTFTQDQVNKILAENKRKLREDLEGKIKEISDLQNKTKTTAAEKDALAKKFEELNNQLLSKDELVKKERERTEKKFNEDLTSVTQERDTWKTRYERSTINNAIIGAAVKAGAFNPNQVLAILNPSAKLDAITEDGKETGDFKVVVDYLAKDDKGVEKRLTLTPEEAVKEMTQSGDYFNLFKDPATGGLGKDKSQGGTGKNTDYLRKLAKNDPVEYARLKNLGKIDLVTGTIRP